MKLTVKVEPNTDPAGWYVHLSSTEHATHRYILPEGDEFLMVNPFADPSTTSRHERRDLAIAAAIKSVDHWFS